MNTFPISASLIALMSVSAAGAAEVDFFDIRLGGGILSDTFKGSSSTTITDNNSNVSTTSESGSDGRDSDGNYRGQLQFVWGNLGSAGGLILGAGVAVNQAQFDNGSQQADVTTPVVNFLIGYGFAVSDNWHVELTPFIGAGRSYYSVQDEGSSSTSKDWEAYYEYGAKIGTYLNMDSGLQVGLEVPYLVGRFEADYEHNDDANTYTVSDSRRNQGFGVLLTLGMRL